MKFTSPYLRRLAGFSVATFVRRWMSQVECRKACYDPTTDANRHDHRGPCIYLLWHEYLLAPFYLRGGCNISMLLSRHRDADWLGEATGFIGFGTVRGSSKRGGATAIRELQGLNDDVNIAITPDGPRGPRRQMAPGPIYLAAKTGYPLVIVATGYSAQWRLKTWDRFAIPKPRTRARIIQGPRMHIPADLDRDGVEHYRQRTQDLMNRLTLEAEAWAIAGTHKLQEEPMPPCRAPLRKFPELERRPILVDAVSQPPQSTLSLHPRAAA